VALHEATDVLHWTMPIALYHPGGMAIKIVIDLPPFFVIVNSVVAHNHSYMRAEELLLKHEDDKCFLLFILRISTFI
jgi:hypothetical protein